MRPFIGIAAAALALALTAPPAAASEGVRSFSASLSYGTFRLDDEVEPQGGVLGFDFEHGLSDTIALRAAAAGGLYYQDAMAYTGHAVVGLTYVFDVLKWVPYVNLGVGGIVVDGAELDLRIEPLIELGAGVDFLQSREFSWGLQARYETYTTRTHFLSAGLRMTWRWGFF